MEEESSPSLASFLVPAVTIGLVVFVQVNFWLTSGAPTETDIVAQDDATQPLEPAEEKPVNREAKDDDVKQSDVISEQSTNEDAAKSSLNNNDSSSKTPNPETKNATKEQQDDEEEDLLAGFNNSNGWRCVCEEGSFLPPALLKTFGSAEAMVRLGTGQCYHKQM